MRVLGCGGLQPPHLLPISGSVSRRLPPRLTTSRSLAPPSTAPPPRVWIPDRSTIILVPSTVETETKSKTDTETITCPLPTLASENLQRHNIGGARWEERLQFVVDGETLGVGQCRRWPRCAWLGGSWVRWLDSYLFFFLQLATLLSSIRWEPRSDM